MPNYLTYPQRIVCLTEETTETIYLLGEQDRLVGISGFTVRPPQARKEKPKVSAFLSAKTDKILALEPDLVLAFSDIQADIVRDLVKQGINVHVFNHRTIAGILQMICQLGGLLGCQQRAEELADELASGLDEIRASAARLHKRPKVYFEEWDEPQITGIGWVSELVAIAGGDDIFPERAVESLAKNRILADGVEAAHREPDIIFGSWCGKKFRPEKVREREGWANVPAVRNNELHEIKSSIILQPGPAALTDGVRELHEHIKRWAEKEA
ncbi:MAG TPA: cobalamin-binding protein [Gammaproteobacteria bacterium]|nr:cobalamin-binding protein [Gammaproteobacteria bacterium]